MFLITPFCQSEKLGAQVRFLQQTNEFFRLIADYGQKHTVSGEFGTDPQLQNLKISKYISFAMNYGGVA